MHQCQPLQSNTLIELGIFLHAALSDNPNQIKPVLRPFFDETIKAVDESIYENPWFTPQMVRYCFSAWANTLQKEHVEQWFELENLPAPLAQPDKTVAVVMAGNLPLVGFHDIICVLASGKNLLAKLSSSDKKLPKLFCNILTCIQPGLEPLIHLTEDKISGFDAVIATGSDNTSLYFDYYFGKYPNIIRKNRNSIAVLSGNESPEQLNALADDIFIYYGLGCRNVSRLFVPEGYHFPSLFPSFEHYAHVADLHKYANNYDFYKSIFLINKIPHLDNGFMLMTPNDAIASAVSVIHYQYYKNISEVNSFIESHQDKIQCVASSIDLACNTIAFGQTQLPSLSDYADGINTLDFLKNL